MRKREHPLLRLRPAIFASLIKRLLRIRRRFVEVKSGSFYVDPASHFGNSLIMDGGYEPDMEEVVSRILDDGDVFVDLGANEGYFSIVASKLVGRSGRVITIEPQARLQQVLFQNIAANGAWNATVVQFAISDSPGLVEMLLLPDINTGGSGLFRSTRYKLPKQAVIQLTLEDCLSKVGVPKVKLIKIDIEGFEYEAILGSKGLFSSGAVENIALELHPDILRDRGKSEQEIVDFLIKCGYERSPDFGGLVFSLVERSDDQ